MTARCMILTSILFLLMPDVESQFFDFFGLPSITHQTIRPPTQIAIEHTTKRTKTKVTTKQPVYSHEISRDSDRPYSRDKQRKESTTTRPDGKIMKQSTHNRNISRQTNEKSSKTSEKIQESSYEIEYEITYENGQRNNPQPLVKNNDNYYTLRPIFEVTTKASYSNRRPANNNGYYINPNTNNYYNSNHNNYETNNNYETVNNHPDTIITKNPFYNQPGVKRPVTESSRPITNKPMTNKPATSRPVTNRPTIKSTVTKRPYVVNSRPTDYGAISFPDDHDEDLAPEVISGPDEDYMSASEKRRYIELSEKMCDKYKSLNTRPVQAIPLLPFPQAIQFNVSSCTPINIPLVVGGTVVSVKEFPHMALLGWVKLEGGYAWKCGGSLISDQYILTAAHCAYEERDNTILSGPPRVVQLGSSYMDDPGALVVKVSAVIRHPKYKLPKSYYDLALVKLQTPVKFSEVIRPACLGEPPATGQPIIATGWGQTAVTGDQSLELRSVSLPIWDTGTCHDILGTSRRLPQGVSSDSQICAGEIKGGKDTCQGDSGGPAQLQDGCLWRVVAVTSLGRSCGAPNTPGLYAKVHRAFIASQVFGGIKNNNFNQDDGATTEKNDRFGNSRDSDTRNDDNDRDGNNDYNNNHNKPTRYDNNNNRNVGYEGSGRDTYGTNYGTTSRFDNVNTYERDNNDRIDNNNNRRENKYNSGYVNTYDNSGNNQFDYTNSGNNNDNRRNGNNNFNSNNQRQANSEMKHKNNRDDLDNGRMWWT